MIPFFHESIELAAEGIEVLAVAVMVICTVLGTARWPFNARGNVEVAYKRYRGMLAKSLLIGLELLVAADIVRTVLVEPTLPNIATLGALVVIRTFLGWSLTVEAEGHWPWRGGRHAE